MKIYVDGSSKGNPGPAGIGVYVPEAGIQISVPVGEATNNEAEWTALVVAAYVSQYIQGDTTIHSDSQLVVKQFNQEYDIKKPELMELYELARYYADNQHKEVIVKHTARTGNKMANTLAQEAADSYGYVIVEKGLEKTIRSRIKQKGKHLSLVILPRQLVSIFPPTPPHGTDAIIPEPKAVVVRERNDYLLERYETVLITSEKRWYVNGKPYAKVDWL